PTGIAVTGLRRFDLASRRTPETQRKTIYERPLARFAIWRADAAEETGVHINRRRHVGAGDRGEYGHLQCGQCGIAQTAAVQGAGAFGNGLEPRGGGGWRGPYAARGRRSARLAGAEPILR